MDALADMSAEVPPPTLSIPELPDFHS
jgi:hypothetical protein